MAVFNLTLLIDKVGKLDVCGRPLFANLVTFVASMIRGAARMEVPTAV